MNVFDKNWPLWINAISPEVTEPVSSNAINRISASQFYATISVQNKEK